MICWQKLSQQRQRSLRSLGLPYFFIGFGSAFNLYSRLGALFSHAVLETTSTVLA